jgi:hypothetical protein
MNFLITQATKPAATTAAGYIMTPKKLATNVQLQMTFVRAQASTNVPAAERPNGREARAGGKPQVCRRICSLLGAGSPWRFQIV